MPQSKDRISACQQQSVGELRQEESRDSLTDSSREDLKKGIEESIRAQLFSLQDAGYRAFQCQLMPTVDPASVIGVRMPALRKLAKEIGKTATAEAFLTMLPHKYYEENNLHGLFIAALPDYCQAVAAMEAFLPYVDNWATCDLIHPKAFVHHLPELLEQIRSWLSSSHPYTIRFGMEMLMVFYLDQAFSPAYLEMAAAVRSEDYYVKMMLAWFFATALAKQWQVTLPYLSQYRLAAWVHNKTIQKANESYRITAEQKDCLRQLRLRER